MGQWLQHELELPHLDSNPDSEMCVDPCLQAVHTHPMVAVVSAGHFLPSFKFHILGKMFHCMVVL